MEVGLQFFLFPKVQKVGKAFADIFWQEQPDMS